jgi:hypothetical protein
MAVIAEIKTGKRRVLDYLLSSLCRYRHDLLRELSPFLKGHSRVEQAITDRGRVEASVDEFAIIPGR